MSNGEIGAAKTSWAEMKFTPSMLLGLIGAKSMAVENAEGDVKGANEKLREDVMAAQRRVDEAERVLAYHKHTVAEHLNQLGLIGRTIEITQGTSLKKEESLASLKAVISDVEVGALNGAPIEPANAIVLHVEGLDGGDDEATTRHAFIAGNAQFTINEIPQPAA